MEQGWLLSNAIQQSGKPEAPVMVLQLAPVSSLITPFSIFKIINLVMETAAQIIVGASFLTLLQSNSAFRASVRVLDFIQYCQQTRLRFSAFLYRRFVSHHRDVVKNARDIVLLQKVEMLLAIKEPVCSVEIS
ncbi:hypothetical protein [Rheinheimera sp. MM224]|uniref:hypothetical protein n=1 Tax=Rheinheimera sp. MM224 TaxID=3019969 RepID=UPI0021F8E2F7|nr:hypothetical protein [Rheinheimera sp. MM224]CAI3804415.1 hypothetical protein JAMGFMIE_03614 [Rheinheimera sp. MM224]